ncbi:MAG TPA: SigE family RNA polymerase sigma factor [Micromonosporaceae bacterium]|nr:SigE family RNA polymerase sigma factor [Micromonosporaceae bacterium]
MTGAHEAEFDAFYRAHYPDLVAMAYALGGGDLAEAQDLVQEAFCRAWRRWDDVSRYDKPAAWVRRVATNLATSRWRRLRTARIHLRLERSTDVPGLEPDHVALVAAMRTLPAAQRRAMILHYIVDLPVDEVAAEIGVPPGTVKSWLHRGRTALAALLTDRFEEVNDRD